MTIAVALRGLIVVSSLASEVRPLIWFYIAAKNPPKQAARGRQKFLPR